MTVPNPIGVGSASPCWLASMNAKAYELLKTTFYNACIEWLQEDWPRAANEEAMTPKLLTQISQHVRRIMPQIQGELQKPPFYGTFSFDYVETTKCQEHELGADFAVLVELNLARYISAERFSLFQAKLFDHNSTEINREQLEKLRGFTEESYYIFYNDRRCGPNAIPYILRARTVEAVLAEQRSKTSLSQSAVMPFALDFDRVLTDHLISLWEGEDHIKTLQKVIPVIKNLVPRVMRIGIRSEGEISMYKEGRHENR